jgi:formylmethanofuran dehydrogenase subunit C
MRGGEILIHGNAGHEVGSRMRRGLIAIAGSADQWVGKRMLAGTIGVTGPCGLRPGAGMRRRTIGLFGGKPAELLPTFRFACRGRLPVLAIVERQLRSRGFPLKSSVDRDVDLFHGDFLQLGRGELLLGGE